MTAEIAVMNKSGIALAADSAGSVETPDGTKIYNANKLFMLSKHYPVGIMVYGNSTLMELPWETIIKHYRNETLTDKPFDTLEEYAKDFISHLDKNTFYFPPDEQKDTAYSIAVGYFETIVEAINERVEQITHAGNRATLEEIKRIINEEIANDLKLLKSFPRLSSMPVGFENVVLKKYSSVVTSAINDTFDKLILSASNKKNLRQIFSQLCVRSLFHFSPSSSGVVVAGFGEKDLYPSVVAYEVEFVINNRLKHAIFYKGEINSLNAAALLPFAQREMVIGFMEGIAPDYKETLEEYLNKLFDEYPDEIIKQIPKLSEAEKNSLVTKMKAIGTNLTAEFMNWINNSAKYENVIPVLAGVSNLPLDELASMAESLVNLTSFKRRITLVAETVGGAIDVAVISKGDGFIWIKRKHYFEANMNPHFARNYYRKRGVNNG